MERFDFLLRLTKVLHHYNNRNAFHVFLNQARGRRAPGFLKLILCGRLYVCVFMCVCVCVSAPEAINN